MAEPRKYAGFWHQKNNEDEKRLREVSVLMDLIKSAEIARIDLDLLRPQINPDDPPDCIAHTSSGERVGIEVTELVNWQHITWKEEQWEDGRVKVWSSEEFNNFLHRLLTSKDGKTYKGGPYERIVVIIHTDEWGLDRKTEKLLDKSRLPDLEQIDEAYLIQSFDPSQNCCPYLRLV